LDGILSLALYSIVGVCVLLLDKQLCHRRLWRYRLPQKWRTLGPVESIIGVLMCGLSASFLFAIVSRLVDREV
jgi:hypothetical protein